MDLVLVGLPGSGKSVVGKRLAHRHGATFIDLDERIEREDGRPIPRIFEEDGEAAFRAMERRAVADLGAPDRGVELARIIATGGGAVVDPRNRWGLYRDRATVWLDGRPVQLTRKEFDLLLALASRPGEVVSKRALLAEVWQQAYGGSDRTVDVHVSWLRRKLGETAAAPRYLHTVRGVGVRLAPPDVA